MWLSCTVVKIRFAARVVSSFLSEGLGVAFFATGLGYCVLKNLHIFVKMLLVDFFFTFIIECKCQKSMLLLDYLQLDSFGSFSMTLLPNSPFNVIESKLNSRTNPPLDIGTPRIYYSIVD